MTTNDLAEAERRIIHQTREQAIAEIGADRYNQLITVYVAAHKDDPGTIGNPLVIDDLLGMTTTPTRRRVQNTDGVVFTEHPSGCWVMEDDPDSYRRLIDTWDSYEQLLGDAVELTELEPAPAYTAADLADPS